MGTFILIVIVIVIIGLILSAASDRSKRVKDYNNQLDFEKKMTPNPNYKNSILAPNKEQLYSDIVGKASDKRYAYENSSQLVELCNEYFTEFNYDLTIIEIIITASCTDKNFIYANSYADILINHNIDKKWGYFFKGEISWYQGNIIEGNTFFNLSEENGMNNTEVRSRKFQLIDGGIKPKTTNDKEVLGWETTSFSINNNMRMKVPRLNDVHGNKPQSLEEARARVSELRKQGIIKRNKEI